MQHAQASVARMYGDHIADAYSEIDGSHLDLMQMVDELGITGAEREFFVREQERRQALRAQIATQALAGRTMRLHATLERERNQLLSIIPNITIPETHQYCVMRVIHEARGGSELDPRGMFIPFSAEDKLGLTALLRGLAHVTPEQFANLKASLAPILQLTAMDGRVYTAADHFRGDRSVRIGCEIDKQAGLPVMHVYQMDPSKAHLTDIDEVRESARFFFICLVEPGTSAYHHRAFELGSS